MTDILIELVGPGARIASQKAQQAATSAARAEAAIPAATQAGAAEALKARTAAQTAEQARDRAQAFARDAQQTRASFPDYFEGPPGGPGGNVMSTGRFRNLPDQVIPAGAGLIKVDGNTAIGDFGAGREFARDPAVDAAFVAANPATSFLDKEGKGLREIGIRPRLGVFVENYGPLGTADDSATFNAALREALKLGVSRIYVPRGIFFVNIEMPPQDPDNRQWTRTIEWIGVGKPSFTFGTVGSDVNKVYSGTTLRPADPARPVFRAVPSPNGFAINCMVVVDMAISGYDNPRAHAIDARWASQLIVEHVQIDTGRYSVDASEPTHGAIGILTPGIHNDALTLIRNVQVSGYFVGLSVNEHTNADNINLTCCKFGMEFNGANHASLINRVSIQQCQTNIVTSGPHLFRINQLNIEHKNPEFTGQDDAWKLCVADYSDPNNGGVGTIEYAVTLGFVGVDLTFTKVGGRGVECRRVGSQAASRVSVFDHGQDIVTQSGVTLTVPFNATGVLGPVRADPNDPTQLIALETGTYRAIYAGAFAANPNGTREMAINRVGFGAHALNNVSAPSAGVFSDDVTCPAVSVTEGQRFSVTVRQNSGGNLNLLGASNAPFAGRLAIEKISSMTL